MYERRAVTILSTDMVGYSRMMARAPDATVEAVRYYEDTLRQSCTAHNGRVFSYAGDGFLVEFASETLAVKCALDIQATLRDRNADSPREKQVWLRSGIHHGEAIVDKENLHGDVVNIAVRLQETAPTGGLLVSAAIKNTAENEAGLSFNSIGLMRFKNIPEPLEAFEVEVPGADGAVAIENPFEIDVTKPVLGFGERSAIAIFPLNNASRSVDHSHVAEGFSHSLIVALSHMRQFPVIDRNTSFALNQAGVPLQTAASRIGARYIVSGEFADHEDQFRISLRMMDGSTGHYLWTDSYLLDADGLIPALEEVCTMVAGTLEAQLEQAETVRARAGRLSRADITTLVWRGRWHLNKLNHKDSELAREILESAIEQDPDHSEALIQLSFWHWLDCWTQRRPEQNVDEFYTLALRALQSNQLDSRGHFLLGAAEILRANPVEALARFERSIALNPSHAHAHSQIGSCHMLMGKPERAIESLEASLRLNPEDYYLFVTIGELACSYCMSGDFDKAISLARRSLGLRPSYWHARMTEITALVRSDQPRRAVQALEALLIRRPDFFDKPYVDWLPFQDKTWNAYFGDSLQRAREYSNSASEDNKDRPAGTVTTITV